MLLPDIETWKKLTDNGTIGSGSKEWQRLDDAYMHFYLNQRDPLARKACEDALDAFLLFKHNKTTRNRRGALSALKATITTKPDSLTRSTLEAALELRKAEENAIFRVLGTLEFAENPKKKHLRHALFANSLNDFKSSADEVSSEAKKIGLLSEGASHPGILDNCIREFDNHFKVSEIVGHATSSMAPARQFLDKFKDILSVIGPLTPIISTGKIVHNLAQIVNNSLDFQNNKVARAFAKKGDVQFSIDVLNERINSLNNQLGLDTVRAVVDIGSFLLVPVTAGVSKLVTDSLGAAIDVLVAIQEMREIDNTIIRVNSEIKEFRNKKEFLDLMLDVPELAAYFLCNIETNTFLKYCSFQINQPFFMLIVEENKNKIDSIIQQSRNIIENSPYQVKHFHNIEKEVQIARDREIEKIQRESQEIIEISQKIQEIDLIKKQKEEKTQAEKQRRFDAWRLLEAKTRETVAEYEKETSADVTGIGRLFLGVRRSDQSLAAIEELKKELAGTYGPEAKLLRIRQLTEFLLGKWGEWHNPGLLKLKNPSRLHDKLLKNYNEFLAIFPEYKTNR